MDVTPLRVKKLETLFAQQSVQLRAAKVSRLAHDGSQPMAPSLSSGALCVCVYVCVTGREKKGKRERNGERERDLGCSLTRSEHGTRSTL